MLWVAVAAATPTAPDERALAYALAYSGYVAQACPGWEQRFETVPPGFLPPAATANTAWADGEPRRKAYRKGGRDAAADRRADDRFCEHPVDRRAAKAPPLRALLNDRRSATVR